MAELLIILENRINPVDPIANLLLHKEGDFIIGHDDFHVYGNKEIPPVFSVIKIPTIDKSLIRKYEEVYYDPLFEIVNMRIWKFDLVKAGATLTNKLTNDGELTIKTTGYTGDFDLTWEEARTYFYDKKNDVYETMDLP